MNDDQEYLTDNYFIVKPNKAIYYFWLGFIITTVNYTLMVIDNTHSKIFIYLQFVGIIIFVPAAVQLVRYKIESKYLASMYILYFIWSITIVARGFSFNRDYLIEIFVDSYGGIFLYLSPFILLFPINLIYIKKVFNVAIILSAIFLLFSLSYLEQLFGADSEDGQRLLESFARFLIIPCGFVLLMNAYQSNKRNLFALFIILFTFLLAVVRARRGLIFISLNIIIFSFIFYFYNNKGNLLKRFLPVILMPLVLLYAVVIFNTNKSNTFSNINERIDEDTRSAVVAFFVLDMDVEDWLIGRGINGEYYCPVSDSNHSDYRNVIETNYLQIILKGGLISLGIFLLITIPAIIKGLFYSDNLLSKASGLWILFWLIDMYPTTVTVFALNYLIVWICVGICYSKQIRKLSDNSIVEFFRLNTTKYLI
jgi:hypothetical protein